MAHVVAAGRGSPIHKLDPALAAKIAAGEVVERPASVVKELLENAIDAGATRVRVELEGGGQALIRVQDDGCGIPADEVGLAFQRHATSKLAVLDDLCRIRTLGFRGEALPSIAAVAEVELATRAAGASHGVVVHAHGTDVTPATPRGLPYGTTVTVRDLFAAVPARLKFLKSRAGEVAAVQGVVANYAMAYPQLRLTLYSDGRPVFSSPGSGKLADVLGALYGAEVVGRMLELRAEHRETTVRGLTSPPDITRPSRVYQSFFVNGRWVRNRMLTAALEEAYHTHLMVGRHPICVVYLSLPPELVDVNVHPAKTEVKFLYDREVFVAVRNAASAAVLATMPEPGRKLTGLDPPTDGSSATEQPPLDLEAPVELSSPGPRDGAAGPAARPRSGMMPLLRVLGQASNLYIIAEGPDGVYMVDQHAAHERVLFDELMAAAPQRPIEAQFLLEPLAIELSPAQFETLDECAAALAPLGFQVEPFGMAACLVRAVPAVLSAGDPTGALRELLESRVVWGGDASAAGWRERSLTTIACRSAVKAGQPLSMEEMRQLIYRLETTARPRTCPHGRPTMILLTASQLEREFGRRG
jgi:DNA mismatch repair protein MutL